MDPDLISAEKPTSW